MNKKTSFGRFVAGLTALLLVLTPMPLGEMGISTGIGMTASAEEANTSDGMAEGSSDDDDTSDGGEENNSEDGGEPDGGEENGSDNGESSDGEDENSTDGDASSDGEDENDDTKDDDDGSDEIEMEEIWINDDTNELPDSDELFNEYVNRVFYGETDFATFDNPEYGYESLTTEGERDVYNALKPVITKIANGEESNASITITTSHVWTYTQESLKKIHIALLTDLPYDFYWYDKTQGLSLTTYKSGMRFIFSFTVAGAYAGSGKYTTDTAKTTAASKSAANANLIVEKYAGLGDYKKLSSYCDELCEMVEYNHDAVNYNYAYGDPWQLIYAFDGDPTTNIVCEGYSKAFQYLCDISTFENSSVNSAIVTGTSNGGNHMWNIVSINDVSYLVDVTNCDAGQYSNGYLFLKGVLSPSGSGFTAKYYSGRIKYVYSTDTKNQYSSEFLTLSANDYEGDALPYAINVNDDAVYLKVDGERTDEKTVSVTTDNKIEVCVDIKDYIDHKLSYSVNGSADNLSSVNSKFTANYYYEEIEFDLTDSSNPYIDISLTDNKWSESERSEFAKLVLDDGITVYPLDADNNVDKSVPIKSGDYVENGFFGAIVADNSELSGGKYISINGVKTQGTVNGNEYRVDSYVYASNEDGEFVVHISNGGYKYKAGSEDIYATVSDTALQDGDILEDGAKISFDIRIKNYIDRKFVINGKTVTPTLNKDYNTFFDYEYTVNGSDVEVGLEEEKWSSEETAKYVKLEISDPIIVDSYVNNAAAGWLSDGDYYPRGAYVIASVPQKYIDNGKNLLVNGEIVTLDAEKKDDCYTYTCKVDPEGDTLTFEFAAAVTLVVENEGKTTDKLGFDSIAEAFNYFNKAKYTGVDVTLILNNDITVTKLTIPTKINSFTLTNKSGSNVDFNMSTLSIPVDTTLAIYGDGENLKPITISVAAGKTLNFDSFAHYGSAVTVKGTKTSVLNINKFLTVGGISTFGEVNVADSAAVSVEGNVTGVELFNGKLWLKDPKNTATINKFGKGTIRLYDHDGKNAKVTVSDVTGSLNVELVDPNTTIETAVESGRTILWAGSTKNFTDKITVANKTSSNQALNAYRYGKEIRAEYGNAVTLSADGGKAKSYPNLNLAIANMTEEASYTITLCDTVTVSKLTLPKKAKDITFKGENPDVVLNLNLSVLTIPVDTTFDVIVKGVNSKPVAVSAAARKTLTLNKSFVNLGAVRGTNTSILNIGANITAASLASFKDVNVDENKILTVTGNVSGITNFSGTLQLTNTKSTAAVTTASGMYLDLVADSNGAVAKATISNAVIPTENNDNCGLLIRILDSENGSLVELVGGMTVLWSAGKTDFTENVRIENRSTVSHELSPFLYGREIKAEYAKAIKVYDGNEDSYYPNIESAFKAINNASTEYTVYLNEDVSVSKLTFPKNAGFIGFTGSGSLELDMTALTVPVNTEFGVAVKGTNAKPLAITAAAGKKLIFSGEAENIGAVKGTKTSSLYVNKSITAASIATFGDVVAIGDDGNAVLSVTGNVTGVTTLTGTLALPNVKSTAAVTNAESAVLRLTDVNGTSAKVTVSNVIGDAKLKVVFVDENGQEIKLGAGKTILWMGGKTDISDGVELVNKAKFGNELNMAVYGKEVRADCGNAVTVSVGSTISDYVSIDAAFAAITKENSANDYTITLNEDVSASKFALPRKAKSLTFTGEGSLNLNMTSIAVPVDATFEIHLNGANARPLAISVAAGKTLTFGQGAVLSNIGALRGTKTSTLSNNVENTVASISTFGELSTPKLLNVTGNVSGIGRLYGFVGLPNAKSTMSVSNIFNLALIQLTDNNGAFAKVTVTGMADEKSQLGMSVVDENGDLITLPSGKTILWTNGKNDFTDKVRFANRSSAGTLCAKLYGKEIKAVNNEAVTLTEDGESVGSYATIEEAFAQIKDLKKDYIVTVNDDVYVSKFRLPAKAASLTIKGTGNTVQLVNVSSISPSYDLTVEGITIRNTKAFTISARKNLTLKNVTSDCLSAVKGTAKFTYTGDGNDLTFTGKNGTEQTIISGFKNTGNK